jgi:hypothetical protein
MNRSLKEERYSFLYYAVIFFGVEDVQFVIDSQSLCLIRVPAFKYPNAANSNTAYLVVQE